MTKQERDEIKQTVRDDIKEMKNKGYDVLLGSLFGSQNYGLSTFKSDIDTKVVVIPTLDDLIKGTLKGKTYKREREEQKEGNITIIPLNNFFSGLKHGNTNSIELLLSPYCFFYKKLPQSFWGFYREDLSDLLLIDMNDTLNGIYGMSRSYYDEAKRKGPMKKIIINLIRLENLMRKFMKCFDTKSTTNLFIPDEDTMEFIMCLRNDSYTPEMLVDSLNEAMLKCALAYGDLKDELCEKRYFPNYSLKEKLDEIKKDIVVFNISSEVERIKNGQ